MHTKLRNSFLGLSAVFAFVVGGAFFSEPLLPGQTAQNAAPTVDISPEARIVMAVLGATVSIAQAKVEMDQAEAAKTDAPAPAPKPSRPSISARHQRPSLGMPYFSFASFLPRAPQES